MKILQRTIDVLNSMSNTKTPYGSTYEIIPQLEKLKLTIAKQQWDNFSVIPVDDDGNTLENYTVFQETEDEFTFLTGTDREHIWNWFEEEFNLSIHNDLMFPAKNIKELRYALLGTTASAYWSANGLKVSKTEKDGYNIKHGKIGSIWYDKATDNIMVRANVAFGSWFQCPYENLIIHDF